MTSRTQQIHTMWLDRNGKRILSEIPRSSSPLSSPIKANFGQSAPVSTTGLLYFCKVPRTDYRGQKKRESKQQDDSFVDRSRGYIRPLLQPASGPGHTSPFLFISLSVSPPLPYPLYKVRLLFLLLSSPSASPSMLTYSLLHSFPCRLFAHKLSVLPPISDKNHTWPAAS